MRVLFAALAAVALAQKKQKDKNKVSVRCFGKEDEDHLACKEIAAKEECVGDDKCTWGKDRFEVKDANLAKCMVKEKGNIGAMCSKPGEVDTCKCGNVCHTNWQKKDVCTTCADLGIKEDCDNGPDALSCTWFGSEDEGKCMMGKNDCSELNKKECAAAGDKCMYMKKGKYCMKNYPSSCYGIKMDTHDKCMNVKTKQACMDVKTMFNKPLCKWGMNAHEREDKNKKCIEDVGEMGKTCSSQADCQCGSTCLELDFGGFTLKACSICKDMGAEADCDTAAAAGMGCKWVGGEDGVCLKKDMCRELMFEEDKCKANSMCMWKDDTCMKAPFTKKTCKSIGKRKKGEPRDDAALLKAKIACRKIPECMWTEKNKCANRKSK